MLLNEQKIPRADEQAEDSFCWPRKRLLLVLNKQKTPPGADRAEDSSWCWTRKRCPSSLHRRKRRAGGIFPNFQKIFKNLRFTTGILMRRFCAVSAAFLRRFARRCPDYAAFLRCFCGVSAVFGLTRPSLCGVSAVFLRRFCVCITNIQILSTRIEFSRFS